MTENLPHRAVLAEKGSVDKVRDYRARCAAAEGLVLSVDMRDRPGGLVGCPAARSRASDTSPSSDFLHASRQAYVIMTKPADGPIGENVWVLRHLAILVRQFQNPTYRIGSTMIVLGIILLLIGYFTSLSILYTIGGILVVVGIVLWILGAVGRPVGGRKVWF